MIPKRRNLISLIFIVNCISKCSLISCSPAVVNMKGKVSGGIKGVEVLQKASIHSLY